MGKRVIYWEPRRQKITWKRGRRSSRTFHFAFTLFTWNGDTAWRRDPAAVQGQCKPELYKHTSTRDGELGTISKLPKSGEAGSCQWGSYCHSHPAVPPPHLDRPSSMVKQQNLKIELFFFKKRILLHLHKNCCQKENIFMCSGRPDVTRDCLMECRVRISHVLQTVGVC